MNRISKLTTDFLSYLNIFTERALNTIEWITGSSAEYIVLNVWLKHKRRKFYCVNWGDDLNNVIVSYLSEKKVVSYMWSFVSIFNPINYMCIGSIVDTKTNHKSLIWGSGAMYGDRNKVIPNPQKVYAVRGPLTREYLLNQGVSCPEIYGDPAILLPYIYPSRKVKKYKIGLIPHYADYDLTNVKEFANINSSDSVVIKLKNYVKWEDVVDQICSCDFIASSSLHGLIISDAYDIPNIWVKLSNNIKGNDFKYLDYLKGCGRNENCTPINLINTNIDYLVLKERIEDYQKPQYDIAGLLRACPFISQNRKDYLLKNCKN